MRRSLAPLAVVAALGLMLSGCGLTMRNATEPVGGRVTWVVHATYGDLIDAYRAAPGKKAFTGAGKMGAFATWTGQIHRGGTCEIHTLYPGGYVNETKLGEDMAHEFRHCVEGAFHD